MGVPPLLSGKLEKFGLRVKSPEVGIGVGGKVGTGGGTSLGKPFRVVEGERERRLKNDLFFLPVASKRWPPSETSPSSDGMRDFLVDRLDVFIEMLAPRSSDILLPLSFCIFFLSTPVFVKSDRCSPSDWYSGPNDDSETFFWSFLSFFFFFELSLR
jgi:hypothetical protein